MISVILKWLRWRYWDFEDAITDVIDWQPRRPASPKPLPPAPPEEPHKYVPFHFAGVTFQRAANEQVNNEWWNEIFQRLAAGQLFELRF